MKKVYQCELVYKEELAQGIFDFRVDCADMAKEILPGQFLHIDCGEGTLLRRPISICDVQGHAVRFIFETKGKGTHDLAKRNVGDILDIMGPLGNSFLTENIPSNPVLIGGGIGVFPLYNLAKVQTPAKIFLGFRSSDRVVMEDEFKGIVDTVVATDDGTYGYSGYAVNALEEYLDSSDCDMLYCCGPKPMLKAVKQIAEKRNIPCRLSLEERMGCGIGACLVCTCETKHEGSERYARVCKDGPVFWADEVTLDD